MNNCIEIWQELSEKISTSTSMVTYEMWISKLIPHNVSNGKIILIAPLKSVKETLINQYSSIFKKAIEDLNNPNITDFSIITEDQIDKKEKKEDKKEEQVMHSFLNKNYTFDNFVVGDSNNIAKAAAYTVAENLGSEYNPLFIYGGVGLGKTHILHAIGNHILEKNPNSNIIYVSTEQFVNDYIESIRNNKNEQTFKFREKYRKTDILMIDDVQFLKGKDSSQEALFYTFNDLYQLNKQIIFTSDRHPSELSFLEERLKSRFQSGLSVSISNPDFETRVAIIQKKTFEKHFKISDSIVNFIAENITSNIREIEAAIKKVIFFFKINNRDCADDLLLAREALKEELGNTSNVLSIDSITEAVCSYFNISKDLILGPKKSKNIAIPRQIAIYLINEELSLPLMSIATYFRRDHTTIIYARDKLSQEIEKDNLLKKQIKDIKNLIHKN